MALSLPMSENRCILMLISVVTCISSFSANKMLIVLLGPFSYRGSRGPSGSGDYTYDTSLVAMHSYLGGRQRFANSLFLSFSSQIFLFERTICQVT